MSNRQLEEAGEHRMNEQLAQSLGLTTDEIEQCNWESNVEESDDGVPYYILVTFDEDSPAAILAKIDGLTDHREVRVDVNCFDGEPDDFDPNE